MSKDLEKLVRRMNDSKMINATSHLLVPMFEEHIKLKLDALCSKYRAGEKDFLSDVAQISYIQDVLRELRTKQAKGNNAAKELNNGFSG